jgi:hypothetical protein
MLGVSLRASVLLTASTVVLTALGASTQQDWPGN